jgi:hypothetical protein
MKRLYPRTRPISARFIAAAPSSLPAPGFAPALARVPRTVSQSPRAAPQPPHPPLRPAPAPAPPLSAASSACFSSPQAEPTSSRRRTPIVDARLRSQRFGQRKEGRQRQPPRERHARTPGLCATAAPPRVALDHRQALAAPVTPRLQDSASSAGAHPRAKTVGAGALAPVGLIGSLRSHASRPWKVELAW